MYIQQQQTKGRKMKYELNDDDIGLIGFALLEIRSSKDQCETMRKKCDELAMKLIEQKELINEKE